MTNNNTTKGDTMTQYSKGEQVMVTDESGKMVEGTIRHFDKSFSMRGRGFQSFRVQLPSGRIVGRGPTEIAKIN